MTTINDHREPQTSITLNINEKWFGETKILAPIKLTLAKGSFNVITGPSGGGKTTLLRIIAGLEPAHIDGSNQYFQTGLKIGLAFQEPRLLPWRSLRDNLSLIGISPDQTAALLSEMGLTDAADLFPGQVSLGMARRASLARAYAIEPELLLLDEPLVSLDESTAQSLRDHLITFWQRQQPTVLMVTHNLREALQMADTIILLNGTPAAVETILHYKQLRELRSSAWINTELRKLESHL